MKKAPVLASALAAALVLGACSAAKTPEARPHATIELADGTIHAPPTLPGGVVDITLSARPGTQAHHLLFARLNDGVTYEELADADDAFFSLVSLEGGNGSLAPGDRTTLTLDLPAGEYQLLDLPDGELAAEARTAVSRSSGDAQPPSTRGTIALGTGYRIDLPDDFDATGTWQFVNNDNGAPHEATLVALHDGSTIDDFVAWTKSFDGPPPADFVGGFGALGPGKRGWMQFDRPAAGTYALVCMLPGDDGGSHAATGMVATFTIGPQS